MAFPVQRPRRLRANETLRSAVRETNLSPKDFIYPLFVCPGEGVRREISSMPGNYQMSVDELVREAREVAALGIPGVILFGLPESKDPDGSGAYDEDGIVQRAIRAVKQEVKELLVIADCCLCEYTSHGHCGHIEDGDVDNDATLELLSKTTLSQARPRRWSAWCFPVRIRVLRTVPRSGRALVSAPRTGHHSTNSWPGWNSTCRSRPTRSAANIR